MENGSYPTPNSPEAGAAVELLVFWHSNLLTILIRDDHWLQTVIVEHDAVFPNPFLPVGVAI